MAQKIFISYRRQDSGANALGISQYLEHEFGRKNVFIDVDMRAGAKFPEVLEQRLAECKVMLALIGPEWLNSLDEQGHRRLETADDWVRLEIAHALRRNITVIPVRVNGAVLPARAALPEDIRGLLDHQAVTVTNSGFRHEMSGLARDIRAISSPRPWRRFAAASVGLLLLAIALVTGASRFSNLFGNQHPAATSSQETRAANQKDLWTSGPGEWVLYAADRLPLGYYFRPDSVKMFGDQVAFSARFPLKSIIAVATVDSKLPLGVYQDETTVIDCKKSTVATAETTIYDKAGKVISHFKMAEPTALNMSIAMPIPPNSVLSLAQHMLCDKELTPPLSQQVNDTTLKYLSGTPAGDGDIFYGPTKRLSDTPNLLESLFVVRLFQDYQLANLFQEKPILGGAKSYRTLAQVPQFNCTDRTIYVPKVEYFDSENNLVYLNVAKDIQPGDVKQNSPFGVLLNMFCGVQARSVAGIYEGMNDATYQKGGQGEQKITITVAQAGSKVNVSFQTASGGQGEGAGTLTGTELDSISLQSTAPGCPGSYEATFKFDGDAISWSFKGQDCGGAMDGHGTAARKSG
jgi:hypothetical protein